MLDEAITENSEIYGLCERSYPAEDEISSFLISEQVGLSTIKLLHMLSLKKEDIDW